VPNVVRDRVPYEHKLRLARLQRALRDSDRAASIAARHLCGHSPEIAIIGVYRARNAARVRALQEGAGRDAQMLVWALDNVAPELAPWTVGHGPGLRIELLNRLYAHLPADFGGWLVLADDDVVLSMGTLAQAVELAGLAGFGLCQPAHDRNSRRSHRINEAHAMSVARLTTFVEVGPIVLISPQWRNRVLPMPETYGMGPGLESEWMRLGDKGCRLGVLDAVRVSHLGIPGSEYDLEQSVAAFRAEIREQGGRRSALRTERTWRVWRSRPPW
jgi:hypothetical protein